MTYESAYVVYLTALGLFAIVNIIGYARWPRVSISPRGLALLVVLFYFAPVWLVRHATNPDIDNFLYTARLVRSWTYVYTAPWPAGSVVPFHPYLPFEMFVGAIAEWFSNLAHVPFSVPLKAPNVVAAGATALLIRSAVLKGKNPGAAGLASLAYIFNPLVVGVTAYHGQFDAVPAFLAFAAWFELRFGTSRFDRTSSALLLGLAILSKSWPLVLLPLFVWQLSGSIRDKALWAGLVLAVPGVISLGYALALGGSLWDMVDVVGNYHGIYGLGGYPVLLQHLPGGGASVDDRMVWVAEHGRTVLWAGVLTVVAFVLARRPKLELAITTVLVALYVFAPASTEEYFLWVLPFAIVSGERAFPLAFALLLATRSCAAVCQSYNWNWALEPVPLDHQWMLFAASYGVMAVWLVWLVARSFRSTDERQTEAPLAFQP